MFFRIISDKNAIFALFGESILKAIKLFFTLNAKFLLNAVDSREILPILRFDKTCENLVIFYNIFENV